MSWQQQISSEIKTLARDENLKIHLGLPIYARAYRLRVIESLREDFPILSDLLGKEFNKMAFRYLAKYPPHCANLLELGKDLSSFLAEDNQELSYLSEVAQFEWAILMAENLQESEVQLEHMTDSCQISLSQTTKVFSFNHRWSVEADDSVMVWPEKCFLMVSAKIPEQICELVEWEYHFFKLLESPISISDLAKKFVEIQGLGKLDESPVSIQDFFSKWMRLGVFSLA